MSRKTKAFLSSLIVGVIFLAVFFFILPWLLIVLAVIAIAGLASVFFGRGSINITTVRITNTPHGNLIQTIKTVSPTVEYETCGDRELLERIPDTDITIYPDSSISEADHEEEHT
jgi:hypothetical protein